MINSTIIYKKIKNDLSIGFERYGTVFKTNNNFYFYDTGTGKVLQCEEHVYQILKKVLAPNKTEIKISLSEEQIRDGIEQIEEAIKNESILSAKPVERLVLNSQYSLDDSFNQLQQICLEVTERCNLRCEYCIYQDENHQFRNYSVNEMPFETAKRAIDYFMDHANQDSAYIAFYGGEPLLRYDIIKMVIEYVRKHPKRPSVIRFTMTTNGTLMTKEMANYFASLNCFDIVFSIDGDEITHNRYRKTITGEGSFADAFRGFKNAAEAYGEKAREHISINTVVAPPYSSKTFDDMQQFFSQEMKDYLKQYSYVIFPDSNGERTEERLSIMKIRNEEDWQPVLCWQKASSIEKEELFSWNSTARSLLIIHKRRITSKPSDYKFNGCCVPGGRKLYVTTKGAFKVCERIGEAPNIGDIYQGINKQIILEHYINAYEAQSIPKCANCWAINLCGVCYALCFDKNGINMDKKELSCEEQRYSFQHDLEYYHQILEDDPESLCFLNYESIS